MTRPIHAMAGASPLWMRLIGIAACSLALAACGGSGGGGASTSTAPTPSATTAADISVLMIGNSHSSVNDLPKRLQTMLQAARPGKTVAVAAAPDWMFLEEHLFNSRTTKLVEGQAWSAVILQAQKYSTSGLNTYSTREAETFVRMARLSKALPVMFPEWPRKDTPETDRIYNLHVSIAQKEPACVAPMGQAWDLATLRHPDVTLYDFDGNHSAPAGAHLAALVLFATLTNLSPNTLPTFSPSDIPASVQLQLKQVVADTLQSVDARKYCPADKPL